MNISARQSRRVNECIEGIEALNMDIGAMRGGDGSGSFWGYSAELVITDFLDEENEYLYLEFGDYNETVNYQYTDKLAHAWQYHTVSVDRSASSCYSITGLGTSCSTPSTSHGGTTTGSYATLPVPKSQVFDWWATSLKDYVRIPKVHGGTTGKWVVGYVHPWTIISPSVTIGALSLSFSPFIGNEWEWENTFVISN